MNELIQILQIMLPSTYFITIDEAAAVNLIADSLQSYEAIAYVEEYRTGKFFVSSHTQKIATNYEITFARFTQPGSTAQERETIREQILSEAVKPLIALLRDHYRDGISQFNYSLKYGRWDDNEVSITITFTITNTNLC